MDPRPPDREPVKTTAALRIGALALIAAAAGVYLFHLGTAPLYLLPDEVIIANDASALARTGRTLDGAFMPLYVFVQISGSWFMPAIYYVSALFLQVLPLSEWAIRLPNVVMAIASMALAIVVARKVIGPRAPALVAGLVLACAPAFLILSRYALDYTYPVPVILCWLVCLLTGLERPAFAEATAGKPRSRAWFALAGWCLGIGWYTYISSIVMMPVYVALSIVVIGMRRDWRGAAVLFAGFIIPVIFFAVWLSQHPEAFQQTAHRYSLVGPLEKPTALGILGSFDFMAMANRYRHFFGVDFLFELGDVYLPFSTRTTGVFVPAAGVLMAIGIVSALIWRSVGGTVVLLGFLTAPLAASILVEEGAIRRATAMLPFGALLAAVGAARLAAIRRLPLFRPLMTIGGGAALLVGISYLSYTLGWQGRVSETATRVTVIGVVALAMAALALRVRHGQLLLVLTSATIVLQFATVYRDYHGEYVSRLAPWLQGNIKGAVTRVIEESDGRSGPIYFMSLRSGRGDWDLKNRYLPSYWRFYAMKLGREELISRAIFLTPDDQPAAIPSGSLVLGNGEDPNVRALLAAGATSVAEIPEVDRPSFFTVLIK